MNTLCTSFGKLLQPVEIFSNSVRCASKKAGGTTRNKKSSAGQNRRIHHQEGSSIKVYSILATQRKLNWMPGMNVGCAGKLTLISLKPGKVIFTCETPDLNMNHWVNKRFFAGREGQTFYKKYAHVIPTPQHTRFKLISQT